MARYNTVCAECGSPMMAFEISGLRQLEAIQLRRFSKGLVATAVSHHLHELTLAEAVEIVDSLAGAAIAGALKAYPDEKEVT